MTDFPVSTQAPEDVVNALSLCAVGAAGAFLRAQRYPAPSEAQGRAIANRARELVLEMVSSSDAANEVLDLTEIARRAAACGVMAAGTVMGLVPPAQAN